MEQSLQTRIFWSVQACCALAISLVFAISISIASYAGPKFPDLTGRVVDNANLLDGADEALIAADLEQHEKLSTDQLVVVTVKSLQGYPIEEFGYQLGRHWGIGQKGKDNGVLLIVAPNERKVRIEVGRNLEPILTDALSKIIIENGILPHFRKGNFAAGIKAGVKDILDSLKGDAEAVKQRAKRPRGNTADQYLPLIFFLIWLTIVVIIVWNAQSQPFQGRRNPGGIVIIPTGSSRGWEGRGRRSGGGFSGGGGSFSGGGSTGSW